MQLREAGERNDAQAIGLLKLVQTYNFVAAVHTLCDVLPSLSQLSKAFQSSVIDLPVVKLWCRVPTPEEPAEQPG